MPARQHDRYSVARQTSDLRNVVVELIGVTVVLAVALNLISDMIFATVDDMNIPILWRWLAFFALVGGSGLAVRWFWRRNDRLTTEEARIDLLAPYEINDRDGLIVPALLPQAPYSVISRARRLYENAHSKEARRKLGQAYRAWQAEQPNRQFEEWAAALHHQLVDALLLVAIDFYNERALGGLSRTAWLRTPLPGEQRPLDVFPERLSGNPFLRAKKGWRVSMPAGVDLEIEERPAGPGSDEAEAGWVWRLRHERYGQVTFVIEKAVTADPWRGQKSSAKARALRVGLPDPPAGALCVALGSRIRARAEVRGVLGRGRDEADCFCNWATQLLSILEQGLDYAYFEEERRPAQLLQWISGNVEDAQARLERLERRLGEMAGASEE